MKQPDLYPLQFHPILVEKVWGGTKLQTHFGKEAKGPIGESWELSGVANRVSVVAQGALQGKPLSKLLDVYGPQLVGERVYQNFGNTFPLLFKFIDAREDLSVQLHPDDELAQLRHDSFGKTEMWYVMEAEKKARLILGFTTELDTASYSNHVAQGTLTDVLREVPVVEGDSFLITPGSVHAIGGGIVLAEIQQTSDITYRIYDWDRLGLDGKPRKLHTAQALEAIDFKSTPEKALYKDEINTPILLQTTDYFETRRWQIDQCLLLDVSHRDSFTVLMCVEGELEVQWKEQSYSLRRGETLLIPACIDTFQLESKKATFLEVYIP